MTTKEEFEHWVFGMYFVSQVRRNNSVPQPRISGALHFVPSRDCKTMEEFLKRAPGGLYEDESLNIAWGAWQACLERMPLAIASDNSFVEEAKRLLSQPPGENVYSKIEHRNLIQGLLNKLATPVPMVLHCPNCLQQHIDGPNPAMNWTNPPHRSHLCSGCGFIWRPADVPTVGVRMILTKGSADGSFGKFLSA